VTDLRLNELFGKTHEGDNTSQGGVPLDSISDFLRAISGWWETKLAGGGSTELAALTLLVRKIKQIPDDLYEELKRLTWDPFIIVELYNLEKTDETRYLQLRKAMRAKRVRLVSPPNNSVTAQTWLRRMLKRYGI